MDEIFDRIKYSFKRTKIKHQHLVASLIATEILGILVFLWILRTPIYEKYLTHPSKAYSISQMDNQKNYLMYQGDFLSGQINPNNTLVILIWENNQVQTRSKLKPDLLGNWNYQLPINLKPGVKIATIGELDASNNTWVIESYRIRIKPRNIIYLFNSQAQIPSIEKVIPEQEEISKTAFDVNVNQIFSRPLKTTLSQPQEE